MEFKRFGNKYVIRFDRGEEVVDTLKDFCKNQSVTLGSIMGIGAVNKATIGTLEIATKEYHSMELTGDYEITSLMGNISTMNGEVYLHLHINLAGKDHKTYGGHLNSATISATGEITVEAIEGKVDRQFNEEIGLNLYKFN